MNMCDTCDLQMTIGVCFKYQRQTFVY